MSLDTVETDDGALIYVQYCAWSDFSYGIGSAPLYVEASDERYQWLNHVQAVGKGELKTLRFEWFEVQYQWHCANPLQP